MPHVREREPNPDEVPQDTAKKAGDAPAGHDLKRRPGIRSRRRDRRRHARPAARRLTI